jgi:hypothetical protein
VLYQAQALAGGRTLAGNAREGELGFPVQWTSHKKRKATDMVALVFSMSSEGLEQALFIFSVRDPILLGRSMETDAALDRYVP